MLYLGLIPEILLHAFETALNAITLRVAVNGRDKVSLSQTDDEAEDEARRNAAGPAIDVSLSLTHSLTHSLVEYFMIFEYLFMIGRISAIECCDQILHVNYYCFVYASIHNKYKSFLSLHFP